MTKNVDPDRIGWAIGARERSQRLLLALYRCGETRRDDLPDTREGRAFLTLVGIAFSLWRAAFLADAPTRDFRQALGDAQTLLGAVLSTNTVAFGTEHHLQGWTGGFYLNNAKLRLEAVLTLAVEAGRATDADVQRVASISLFGTNPHDTWSRLCEEAERIIELFDFEAR